ncbi:MAG: DsbE family thiol:disulfide interchange protein [Novosphingobium sp.]|uniref:DsbE family thiol:disulfide interchange protein n=1 Tax=Novosphingobium sp. TaxID=1874826 RepID=UPI003C7A3CBD
MKGKLILWLPLVLMLALFLAFWRGLQQPDDHVIASQLVGKPLPEFNAIAVMPGQLGAATFDFKDGKPRLLNIFASWCVPCVQEVPMLERLKANGAEIVGVAVHDNGPDLATFLAENGNPYNKIGLDQQGRAQIALGSAGVPETFVVDGKGNVIYQHVGVVTEADIPKLMGMLGATR